jgi:hypothetical protein
MCRQLSLVLFFSSGLLSFGQQTYYDAGLATGPREVLAELAPFYNFMDANLKPWHLKVDYELDDEKGNPADQGVFEYWWASPGSYRSSWTSKNATHSEWHSTDGRNLTVTTGQPLSIYEYWLRAALLSPLPAPDELDPARTTLADHDLGSGAQVRCITAVPSSIKEHDARALPIGLYSEYCVNKRLPILLGYYRFESVLVKCLGVTQTQGKSVPRTILMIDGSRQVLSAKVEPVNMINSDDPALTPPRNAIAVRSDTVQINGAAGSALVVEKTKLVETDSIKLPKTSGKVLLQATIGTDGGLRDVHLISTEAPDLAFPAFLLVTQWHYRPYRINGEPVTVDMPLEIDFPSFQAVSVASPARPTSPR